MKLVHPEWKTSIEFKEGRIQVVNIENPTYYTAIIQELVRQQQGGEGRFILSEANKIYDLSKVSEILLSPFQLDFDNRKIQAGIQKQLTQIANEEQFMETSEIKGKIMTYICELTACLNADIALGDDIDFSLLLKAAGVKVARSDEKMSVQLIDYISALRNLAHVELVIGVNLKSYFSKEDIELIYETLMLRKVPLLLLESGTGSDKIDIEDRLIIDTDLCEI